MILHTVNKSPRSHTTLASCLRVARAPAAILLIEDGVYAAHKSSAPLFETLNDGIKLYALEADIRARGLMSALLPNVELINDEGFVRLSLEYDKVQSWY